MDRKTANKILCAIIDTVDAAGPLGAPEGPMYAALMAHCDLDDFKALLGIAESTGLVKVSGHLVTITPKGHDMAEKIHEAMRAA